jgi:outer membrane protein TolC
MRQLLFLKACLLWFTLYWVGSSAVAASLEDFINRVLTLPTEQLTDAPQTIRSAKVGVTNARNALYPQVSLTLSSSIPYVSDASAGLTLSGNYTLWDYGSRAARLEAEQFELERATLELDIERNGLAYNVAGLYVDVFFLEQALEMLENTALRIETSAAELTSAENFSILNIEALEARESYLGVRNQVAALSYQIDITRRDLFRLVSLQDDQLPLTPVMLADPNAFMEPPNGIAAIVAEHPLLLSVKYESKSALYPCLSKGRRSE